MSLETYRAGPWANSHACYENSAINMRPAPEFATAEVVVASTYRAVGFDAHPEGSVPAAGRELDKLSRKDVSLNGHDGASQETWRTILHGALESPKQPNQSARRFLQLSPIIPDVALYSGSARLSGNSWNPGQLIERMVQLGAESTQAAEKLWSLLFDGLSITDSDDVWARWLQAEFEQRRPQSLAHMDWQQSSLGTAPLLQGADRRQLEAPAVQFTRDLAAILRTKPYMTRRQWVSLLEAIIRLGAVAHVLWVCDVNDRLWREIRHVLDGGEPSDTESFSRVLLQGRTARLPYGIPALPIVRDMASRYLSARLGINLVLWHLEELGHPVKSLSTVAELAGLVAAVANHREQLQPREPLREFGRLRDEHARVVSCKRGIGSNLVEFCRYTLGQRQTADENLRGYDQGYELRKRANYASAPWVISFGPVALLALVHCCLEEAAGPRSVQRLSEHLLWYGIEIDRDDIAKGEIGRNLRMLGLVLDSPDAEGGMLLVPPFELAASKTEGQVQ